MASSSGTSASFSVVGSQLFIVGAVYGLRFLLGLLYTDKVYASLPLLELINILSNYSSFYPF